MDKVARLINAGWKLIKNCDTEEEAVNTVNFLKRHGYVAGIAYGAVDNCKRYYYPVLARKV